MPKKFDQIFQFKIILKDAKPPIWRRIHVPETYTFWDLHVAIQDAMGWYDYHLHEFEMISPKTGEEVIIGIPNEDDLGFGREILSDNEQQITDYFSLENCSADYVYDFGDNWKHKIQLERIIPKEINIKYPICIKGKRACPPEDCGGIWGYEELLKAIKDPKHEQHKEMMDWTGNDFNPEHFDVNDVVFDDPKKRQKNVFI